MDCHPPVHLSSMATVTTLVKVKEGVASMASSLHRYRSINVDDEDVGQPE